MRARNGYAGGCAAGAGCRAGDRAVGVRLAIGWEGCCVWVCRVADAGLPVARAGECARAVALRVSARDELLAVLWVAAAGLGLRLWVRGWRLQGTGCRGGEGGVQMRGKQWLAWRASGAAGCDSGEAGRVLVCAGVRWWWRLAASGWGEEGCEGAWAWEGLGIPRGLRAYAPDLAIVSSITYRVSSSTARKQQCTQSTHYNLPARRWP